MNGTPQPGTWGDFVAAALDWHVSHPVLMWWREPRPDLALALAARLPSLGLGLPGDLASWPEPQECWLWGRTAREDQRRAAMHGLRLRPQGWRWLVLDEPLDPPAPVSSVWVLGGDDLKRYGLLLPQGISPGSELQCSHLPAQAWLWLGPTLEDASR